MSWQSFLLCVGALWIFPTSVHAGSTRQDRILAGIGAADHSNILVAPITQGTLSPMGSVPSSVSAQEVGVGNRAPAVLPSTAVSRALEIISGSRAVLGSLPSSLTGSFAHCQNLFATVCGGQSPKDEELTVGPKTKAFMKNFAASQGIGFNKLSGLLSNVVRHSQNPTYKDLYAKYFAHFAASTPPLGAIFDQAKASLGRAIAKMPVSPSAQEKMEAKLADVSFSTRPNLDRAYEVEEFATMCGPDGMEPTAYARPSEKDIMICPGLVLRALALGGTAELEHYLLHAIGHECTHHIGADILKNQKGQTVGESPFRSEFAATLSCYAHSQNGIDPVAMGGEIAADIGSVKAMAERLQGTSPNEAIKFLRASMGPICGTKADGVHPSDKFRINVLLAQDPEMAEVLGCQVPPSSCALAQHPTGSGKLKKLAEGTPL